MERVLSALRRAFAWRSSSDDRCRTCGVMLRSGETTFCGDEECYEYWAMR